MSLQQEVWVLGIKNSIADRSILWNEELPNLSDPDVLIIYLDSLNQEILDKILLIQFNELRKAIIDKFKNGKSVIFIVSNPISNATHTIWNTWLSPINIVIKKTPKGKRLNFNRIKHPYAEYLDQVGTFDFHFEQINTNSLQNHIGSPLVHSIDSKSNFEVYDNSGHKIGMGYERTYMPLSNHSKSTGEIVFLPPTQTISVSDGIDLLLKKFGKQQENESIPEWIKNIQLSGTGKILKKIDLILNKKKKLESDLKSEFTKYALIQQHTKLLFSKNLELENAVYEAFMLLGFNDIKKIRDEKREDWVFEFKSNSKHQLGAIEVKGSDLKSKQYHLIQCNKWTDEIFHEKSIPAKGIFVINQYRNEPYPESKKKRIHFEPNELEYAKMKGICIIPTCTLFELVNAFLAGKKKSRNTLEKLILKTNGVLDPTLKLD